MALTATVSRTPFIKPGLLQYSMAAVHWPQHAALKRCIRQKFYVHLWRGPFGAACTQAQKARAHRMAAHRIGSYDAAADARNARRAAPDRMPGLMPTMTSLSPVRK